jgi:hypothetical protein
VGDLPQGMDSASKIIFLRDAALRSTQEKWDDGTPFIYTYHTCNYKKVGGFKYEIYVMSPPPILYHKLI